MQNKVIRTPLMINSFTKNVLTLMTGTTFAQALLILISPILTRLYSPVDFGVLTLYTSILNIIVVIASWRYELAIVLPEKDDDASTICILSFLVCLFMGFFIFVVVCIFRYSIARLLNTPELAYWLFFLPISFIASGIYNILNYWSIRRKYFKKLAFRQIMQSTITVSVQLGPVVTPKIGSVGLIAGNIIGQSLSTIFIALDIYRHDRSCFNNITTTKIKKTMLQYRNYPIYQIAAALINTISLMAPSLLLGFFFTSDAVGFYALGNKIVAAPLSIIGNSISNVFFSKLEQIKKEGNMALVVLSTYRKLLTISLLPICLLAIIGPEVVGLIFGINWINSGIILRILCPFILLNFISAPISTIFLIYDKHKDYLLFNIVFLLVSFISFILGKIINDYKVAMLLFSMSATLLYGWFGFKILSLSGVAFYDVCRVIIAVSTKVLLFLIPIIALRIISENIILLLVLMSICIIVYFVLEFNSIKTLFKKR